MWLYLQVNKRYPNTSARMEITEHVLRFDEGILNPTNLYGRAIYIDNKKYEFDRFDHLGSPILVRQAAEGE